MENSAENSMENSATKRAENLNCLFDLYNERATPNFLNVFFAANFNPVKKSKKCDQSAFDFMIA